MLANTYVIRRFFYKLSIVSTTAVLLATGCGTTTQAALSDKVSELEKEVARLKTEKVNLRARSTGLDDRIVVMKKKLDQCQEDGRPLLEVVRLGPGSEETEALEQSMSEQTFTIDEPAGDSKRPALVLSGRRSQPGGTSSGGTGAIVQGGFEGLAPDNLGVVSQEGGVTQGDGTMDAFHEAYRDYSNKRYDEALAKFSSFIHDNAQHPYADNAIFWRGECHLAKGKFFKAIGEFERLFRRYPKSEKIPSGLYRAGFAYDQLRDRAKALEYYFRVVDKHPGTDAARRAGLRVTAIEGKGGRVSNLLPTAAKR